MISHSRHQSALIAPAVDTAASLYKHEEPTVAKVNALNAVSQHEIDTCRSKSLSPEALALNLSEDMDLAPANLFCAVALGSSVATGALGLTLDLRNDDAVQRHAEAECHTAGGAHL